MAVAVASDLGLVGETIAAALGSRGLQTSVLPWGPGSSAQDEPADWCAPPSGSEEAGPDVVLIVCDTGSPTRLDEVRDRGRRCARPWVVMTDADRGPTWGALLEAGARAVVGSGISLRDLEAVLDGVLNDESPIGVVERIGLLRQWWTANEERERLRRRMRSMSPREELVLSMLYEGTTVHAIAERLDVSEATVRSQVKAVLRKLSVASQLAAVAAVDELRREGESFG